MPNYEELCEQVRFGTKLLFQELNDPWGHIAVRLPEDDPRKGFILKHVRVGPPPNDPEAVMLFDEDGNIMEGGQRAIPWELPLYVQIFKARKDVQSCIHTHPQVATALTMAGKTVFAITHQSAPFEHGLPVFGGEMINTTDIGAELAKTLDKWPAALMKGHGAVAVGTSVGQAVQNTLYVEQAARQQVWAATVGTPQVLEDPLIEFHRKQPPGDGGLALWYTKMHVHKTGEVHGGHGHGVL